MAQEKVDAFLESLYEVEAQPPADGIPMYQRVALLEQHYQKAMAKQSETNKVLATEVDQLRKVVAKQREDHDKLWQWVKVVELRLIRAERNEQQQPDRSREPAQTRHHRARSAAG